MEESTANKKRFSPFESKRTKAQRERITALEADVKSLLERLGKVEKITSSALKAPSGLFSGNALLPSALAFAIWMIILLVVPFSFHCKLPLELLGTFALGCAAIIQLAAVRRNETSKGGLMLAYCGWTCLLAGSAALFINATGLVR